MLNEYLTAKDRRDIQAGYERAFKKYELLNQPKVTAVDATVNIYPERRSFDGSGRFTLQNKSTEPISQIHLTDQNQSVSNVQFDRPFHLVSRAPRDLYSIYAFDQPLAPGDVVILTFSVGHTTRGFRDGSELPEFAYNGTFFDAGYFPVVGYDLYFELDDPRRRREEKFGPAGRAGSAWRTGALTPEHLQLKLRLDHLSRRGQHFRRPDRHRSRLSAACLGAERPPLLRVQHGSYPHPGLLRLSFRPLHRPQGIYSGPGGPVNLEVYYDPAHTYDIDDMLASSRAGLDYYQTHFSPYQFAQYRIMEFPRYRSFAQSFPNTVPYSEGIGFIGRVLHKDDIDSHLLRHCA